MLNNIDGVDLSLDAPDGDPAAPQTPPGGPQAGGPGGNPQDRAQQMQDFLDDQRRGDGDPDGDQQDAQAQASDSGNPKPGAGGAGTAHKLLQTVPFLPDPSGDGPTTVQPGDLKAWLAWVRAGRPSLDADWNPSLHPRGPDGQFIERPYSVSDDIRDAIADMDTATVLTQLADEGELGGDLDALLQDPRVRIDGIPDDVQTRQDLADVAGDSPQDAMADAGWVTPDAPDLRLDTADQVEPLYDDPDAAKGSAASQNMDVAHWDDGRKAYIKHFRADMDGDRADGEKPTLAEREQAADAFLRNTGFEGVLPDQFFDAQDGYMASNAVQGPTVGQADSQARDQVDADQFRDLAAALMLAGNSDMHSNNFVIRPDGSLAAIDLNKSGGDFTQPSKFRDRGANMLTNVAGMLGVDLDRDDLAARAQDLAQQVDPDQVLAGVQNSQRSDADRHQFRENIRANIDAFAQGDVQL